MPVKSYLVFPHEGQKECLSEKLCALSWCEVMPAENEDLLVMVTDTKSERDEEDCIAKINEIEELEHYTLVSGFEESK